MAETLYSNHQLADIIDVEGLDGAMKEYPVNPENIANPAVRAAWNNAKSAMDALMSLLPEPWTGNYEDEA